MTAPKDVSILTDLAYETIPIEARALARTAHLQVLRTKGWSITELKLLYRCTGEEIKAELAIPLIENIVTNYGLPIHVIARGQQKPPIPPDILARMLDLQPLAQVARGKNRNESIEYTRLVYDTWKSGVPLYQISRILGVSASNLTHRLIRHGYKQIASPLANVDSQKEKE